MATTIKLGRKKYVVGMNWEFVDPLELNERVKALRKQLGPKGLICQRKHQESVSLGTAPPQEERINGVSLALAIADCHEQPWMGIFEIPAPPEASEGQYWYIAISREQSIVSSSDKIGTREEMEALRNEYMGLGDWQVLEGGIEDLEIRLRDARTRHKTLYPVRPIQPEIAKWLIPLMIVSVLGVGGFVEYQHYEQKLQQARQIQLLAQEEATRMAMLRSENKPVVCKTVPWSAYPRINDLIEKCTKAVEALPLDLNGWQPVNTTCTATGMSVNWKRDKFGNVADAPGSLADGNSSFSHENWLLKMEKGSLSDLLFPTEMMEKMYSLAQKADLKFTTSMNVRPEQQAYPPRGMKKAPPPPYLAHMFMFQVGSLRQLSIFSKIPTARIASINVSGLPGAERFMVQMTVWSKN